MHIIFTGATGRAGAAILQHGLESPTITQISILSRHPVLLAQSHPKATVLPAARTKVTYDYVLSATNAFAQLDSEGEGFNFLFMSGEGSSLEGKGPLFARVKGRTEKALLDLNLPDLRVFNIRPDGIDDQGERLAQREVNYSDPVVW